MVGRPSQILLNGQIPQLHLYEGKHPSEAYVIFSDVSMFYADTSRGGADHKNPHSKNWADKFESSSSSHKPQIITIVIF